MESVRKGCTARKKERQGLKRTSRTSRVFMRCVFCHKFVGIWPEDDRSVQGLLGRLKAYVTAAFTFGICIFQIVSLSKATSAVAVLENAMEAMASIAASAKVAPIVTKRNNLLILLRKTKEITAPSLTTTRSEAKIVDQWLNHQDKIIKILLASYIFAFGSYTLFPIFKKNGLPFEGHLPEICYINPWYTTIYITEIIFSIFRLIGVISNDILCITFLCQLCSELELVKHLITELGSRKGMDLKQTIIRHAIVLDYGGIICETLSGTLLFQHMNCSIFLCISGLITLKTNDPFILLKIGTLSFIGLITMLIICFVGEMVMSSSLEIASTIESSAVYKDFRNDVANLKLLNFMLMRAQKPLCMMVCTQGKLSLRFFSENINKVASFFIYLKTLLE